LDKDVRGVFGDVTYYRFCEFDEEDIQFLDVWFKKKGGIKDVFDAQANDCVEDLYLLL
jgi:hypothetical protein